MRAASVARDHSSRSTAGVSLKRCSNRSCSGTPGAVSPARFAIRIGLLANADLGTVFLDEVGEMSLRMQALLLRFLETGEIQQVGREGGGSCVDVRIIAA